MSDRTDNESITEIVPLTLTEFIEDNINDIKETDIDFPAPHRRLNLPAVTVSAPDPDFAPTGVPYPIKDVEDSDITNSQAQVEWIVGEYNFELQLDLWAGSKEELDDKFDELFNVLNPKITPMGVTLPMEKYYNINCDYLYTGHTRTSGEGESQRDEWRMTMTILATCKAVRSKKEFIIEETEIVSEINKDILVVTEND